VEEGLDAALNRKHSPNSARKRIFDGAAEAKLIALACSPPPKGRKRWTLTLLETAVVQLNIVDHATANTISRAAQKAHSSPISSNNGSFRRRPTPRRIAPTGTCGAGVMHAIDTNDAQR
jgi:hypothetical protein